MSDSKRKKIIYVALVGAVIFGIYNFSQPPKRYAPGVLTQTEQATETVSPATPPQLPPNVTAIEKAKWGRDPFKWDTRVQPQRHTAPAISARESVPGWRLSAIVFSNSLPLAIVNGKAVKVGDIVDQAKVVGIDRKKVTLLYNGASIEIKVSKG